MRNLTYRNLAPADIEDLHAVVSEWSVVRQLGSWPWPARRAFTASRCKPYAEEGFVWGICRDDVVIGSLGMTKGELGYMLRSDYHGQGIMSAAVHHAIETAFNSYPHWDRLRASTWFDNAPSHWLLSKMGFCHFRTAFEHATARGYPILARQYRLWRSDWDRLRTAAQ